MWCDGFTKFANDDSGTNDWMKDDDDFYMDVLQVLTSAYYDCPDRWTGNRCKYQVDNCGENGCMSGASCRAANIYNTNLDSSFYCDCSYIIVIDKDGKTKLYVGMRCQQNLYYYV